MVAQCGNLVISKSSNWQRVKLMEEGCSMVHFLLQKDNYKQHYLSPLKFVQKVVRKINKIDINSYLVGTTQKQT